MELGNLILMLQQLLKSKQSSSQTAEASVPEWVHKSRCIQLYANGRVIIVSVLLEGGIDFLRDPGAGCVQVIYY